MGRERWIDDPVPVGYSYGVFEKRIPVGVKPLIWKHLINIGIFNI